MDRPTPHQLEFPSDPQGRHPRCLGCGYRLTGLDTPACPECGRRFDPDQPGTYTRRRPFVWYRYWWPGALLAVAAAFGWSVFFYVIGAMGWGLFIAVPFMLGALIGYSPLPTGRRRSLALRGTAALSAIVLIVMLMFGGFAGLFCGVILLAVFVPITLVGIYAGAFCAMLLAQCLSQTSFSQREYLPVLSVLLLLPGIAHVIQVAFAPPIDPVDVRTSRVLAMDADAAWNAQLFYEEVPGPRPMLHRIGLPVPEHVEGDIRAAGDREIAYYSKGGVIIKQATVVEPGKRMQFAIVEQRGFEDGAIRFINGRFDFTPIDAGHTRVDLTSHYQPLLRPRALWQPIERVFAGQLHNHILDGMAEQGKSAPLARAGNTKEGHP